MNVPSEVKAKLQKFSHSIRCDDTENESVKIYRGFIEGNVLGVIDNTFSHFSRYASKELKNQLVETFLRDNDSFDPAFHQIATEILKCSKTIDMPESLAKLIEFEWLTFDTEIANCVVNNTKKVKKVDCQSISDVKMNPSLTVISLPFDISELSKTKELCSDGDYFYCIYRDVDHRVNFQRVNQLEYVLISSLMNMGTSTFETEDFQKIDSGYKNHLMQRVCDWHNQNIIELSF